MTLTEELTAVMAQEEETIKAKLRRYLYVLTEAGLKSSDKYKAAGELLEALGEE